MQVCKVLSLLGTIMLLSLPTTIFGQEANNLTGHATNLATTDTLVNFTNTGSSMGAYASIPGGTIQSTGNICVNAYGLNAGGGVDWCCQCILGPNQLSSFSAGNDLTHSGASLTIKLIATVQGMATTGGSATCDASKVNAGIYTAIQNGVPVSINALSSGLIAWGRSQSTGGSPTGTETLFATGQLSTAEAASLNAQCATKKLSGTGYCGTAGAFSPASLLNGFCKLGGL